MTLVPGTKSGFQLLSSPVPSPYDEYPSPPSPVCARAPLARSDLAEEARKHVGLSDLRARYTHFVSLPTTRCASARLIMIIIILVD